MVVAFAAGFFGWKLKCLITCITPDLVQDEMQPSHISVPPLLPLVRLCMKDILGAGALLIDDASRGGHIVLLVLLLGGHSLA